MTRRKAANSGRIIAGIAAFALLFFVVLASFYIARETNHDCSGESCPICANVRQCEAVLHQTWKGAAIAAASYFVIFFFSPASAYRMILPHATLVSRKIRLNN